ncbi:MAG: DEAD/DEAH box helicase [Elusimicrobiaceae bacterium]|nr:DEAD/DEAH box helicase [Elusimicrobiaceae bacterium]
MTNNTFFSLGLSNARLKIIKKLNFSVPTKIQAEAIPQILQGKDIMAASPTGSGKTAAYALPLADLLAKKETARALIIAPTRELAQQIQTVIKQAMQDTFMQTALIVGGKNMQGQLRKLKQKPQFVIATPGRLNDHIKRKTFGVEDFSFVVWDEMDKMLELGFREQIEDIFERLPSKKQSMMFSATYPKRVLKLAEKYLNSPVKIFTEEINKPNQNITQKVIKIEGNEKLKKLKELLTEHTKIDKQILVFVKTQRVANEISVYLKRCGFSVAAMHGALQQKLRDKTLLDFRNGTIQILIATDLASRGLDIPAIYCVINYELPQNPEEYVHRIGRSARYKNKGISYTLIARSDRTDWKKIKEFLNN